MVSLSIKHNTCPLLLIFFFYFLRPMSAAVGYPTPQTNGSDYIRTSCSTTMYPDVCYSTLSRYASSIRTDPGKLARAAISVSLSKAKRMAVYVSNLSRAADYGTDNRASSALHDCFSNFGDAVDQIRGSLKQMRALGAPGSSVRFQISNVQTWMSAALTNEDTCTDGFEDVPDGEMKTEVCGKAGDAKKVTSNALALINSYFNVVP